MHEILKFCAVASIVLLAGCGSETDNQADKAPAGETESAASAKEEAAWREVRTATAPETYAAFAAEYPEGRYAREAAARARIFEINEIGMKVEVAAPEGQFMASAPPELQSDGSLAPSRAIASVPAGTTLNLKFTAPVDGETVEHKLTAVYDSTDGDRMIFRNDDGDCIWNNAVTGEIGYCEGEVPPPPDPDDISALMPYAWLVVARDL